MGRACADGAPSPSDFDDRGFALDFGSAPFISEE
jgi:hypothetical protein